jgi:hypothetical protein
VEYLVTWEIEITADSPEDAAQQARDVQQDPDSMATVFGVTGDGQTVTVDLSDQFAHDTHS